MRSFEESFNMIIFLISLICSCGLVDVIMPAIIRQITNIIIQLIIIYYLKLMIKLCTISNHMVTQYFFNYTHILMCPGMSWSLYIMSTHMKKIVLSQKCRFWFRSPPAHNLDLNLTAIHMYDVPGLYELEQRGKKGLYSERS